MRRTRLLSTVAIGTLGVVVALAAAASVAADAKWHGDLDEGVAAARKSGKPLLVVTGWKSGI